jgi:hypothetical protein
MHTDCTEHTITLRYAAHSYCSHTLPHLSTHTHCSFTTPVSLYSALLCQSGHLLAWLRTYHYCSFPLCPERTGMLLCCPQGQKGCERWKALKRERQRQKMPCIKDLLTVTKSPLHLFSKLENILHAFWQMWNHSWQHCFPQIQTQHMAIMKELYFTVLLV